MDKQEKKNLAPPYMSWKTFSGYIKSLYQTLPPRIDKSAMSRLNGSNQNIMMNALIYLKLIQNDGTPEKLLEDIVESSTPTSQNLYQGFLQEMLKGAYPFLFNGTNAFNIEKSTSQQFDEKFRTTGITGDTIQKSETFFIAAAQEAGIKLSPHILDAKKRGRRKVITQKNKPPKGEKQGNGSDNPSIYPPPSLNEKPPAFSEWYERFKPVFDKLPNLETPKWTRYDRDKWIAALSALLDLYVDIKDQED
jgi:hypothetical protein